MADTYDDVMVSLGLEPSVRKPSVRKPGRKLNPALCGTYSNYVRHIQLREDACKPCKDAKARYEREHYAANREQINARRRKGGAR